MVVPLTAALVFSPQGQPRRGGGQVRGDIIGTSSSAASLHPDMGEEWTVLPRAPSATPRPVTSGGCGGYAFM